MKLSLMADLVTDGRYFYKNDTKPIFIVLFKGDNVPTKDDQR